MRFGWLAVAMLGCGGGDEPTDEDRIDAILDLEGSAKHGLTVYDANCVSCHGVDGSANDGTRTLVGQDIRGRALDNVVTTVVSPPSGMLTFDTLPDQDVADVAAYVNTL